MSLNPLFGLTIPIVQISTQSGNCVVIRLKTNSFTPG